ncbi:MAG: MFS transporter [Ignavibacteriae bacterium HGW-Ignavibacteriae-2]|nr:MAG: MFS transporter [Ignavibacteriae bacterium HGW-Ignavibacteriae-2]
MKNKFQFGNVVTVSIAHLIHDVFSSFLAPVLPLLIAKLNISYSMAGLLTIFQNLPSLINPIIGLLADKLPMRYLLIFAPAVTTISMSLIGISDSYVFLVFLLLIAGVGASLFHVPAPVMIKRISGNRLGKGMSFFMFGGEIARSVGPILILSAVSFWGLEGSYRLMPIGLIATLILFFKFRNLPISSSFYKSKQDEKAVESVRKFSPTFIKIAAIIFFTSLLKGALTTFLPTYITSAKDGSLWAAGISLSVLQLSGALGTFAAGTISDKIGRKNTLLIMAITVPAFMFLFISSSEIFAIPLLLLMGFFMFATTPVLLAIVNDVDSEHPALMNGIFMTINFLISSIAVVAVGFMGDFFGLENAYFLSPLLGLLALPFILKLPSR